MAGLVSSGAPCTFLGRSVDVLLKDGTLVDEDLLQAIQRVVVSQEFLVLRARFNV